MPPPPLTDAASALIAAIRGKFAHFGAVAIEKLSSRCWASASFRGARHELAFRLEGEGAEAAAARFLSELDARQLKLRGHLVAGLSLIAEERRPGCARIRLQALTVETD